MVPTEVYPTSWSPLSILSSKRPTSLQVITIVSNFDFLAFNCGIGEF